MDEKISKLFLPLLDKLYNTEPAGEPFRHPVDPIKYGCYDYYLYVKHPIDLSTIRQKLVTHQYTDAWRFIADIELMFKNAYLFNKKGTPVYEFTNRLKKIWNSELTNVMQRLNYCCGTLHMFGPQLLFCHGTTPDRYCQIAVGGRYKIYQDSYSFCIPCFNKIDTDHVSLQTLTCETTRMNLPTQPVKKSDFSDCTNDRWQYESYLQCTQCPRRIHQICDLYPTHEEEVKQCPQQEQIEQEQREQCHVPPDYEPFTRAGEPIPENLIEKLTTTTTTAATTTTTAAATTVTQPKTESVEVQQEQQPLVSYQVDCSPTKQYEQSNHISDGASSNHHLDKQKPSNDNNESRPESTLSFGDDDITDKKNYCEHQNGASQTSLDDELLEFARSVDDCHDQSAPCSPNAVVNLDRFDSAKNIRLKDSSSQVSDVGRSASISRASSAYTTCSASSNTKNSVDKIAARLSISKLSAENNVDERQGEVTARIRDRYVCNHCYRKERLGFNLRHRKWSARRLPHTRMSRYIETKVNEYIRENSPTAGEMTIRVLTAYRDKTDVKQGMRDYIDRCRDRDPDMHPNLAEYPSDFEFTTRAIFAWQEIDGVDVCVFGMHVQEYGEDCPEPNRQVVYLSYLDSVHFFRPKQFRTAVYHEILLSYFKYVKKLGFRRVFIWVCPSRKGDDYIFYRHPSEQKMPTLKRLSDWYIHLLDKGVVNGIVDRHQNIFEYARSEGWTTLFSMPYLSGDYWPGEFERLLKFMIESQKKYDEMMSKRQEQFKDLELNYMTRTHDMSGYNQANNYISLHHDRSMEEHNILSLSNLYQKSAQNNSVGKMHKNSMLGSIGLKPASAISEGGDILPVSIGPEDSKFPEPFTPSSSRSGDDQPLDLSKSNSVASPESIYDDEQVSDASYKESNPKKRRRKSSATMGYTKKRNRNQNGKNRASQSMIENSSKYIGKNQKKSGAQSLGGLDTLFSPGEELIKNLENSLRRQREGFIVVRLSECDCSPHFESQRRREEKTFSCEMMKGREPFLQLARLKNYEFSTLRRAKFSSLAMVRHLSESFKLDPICNECFSFDSSKRHYACNLCEDYYLCTSCHENTHHQHVMSLLPPISQPDIDEFLSQCAANSISSASSTISNKSCNETSLEMTATTSATPPKKESTFNLDNGHLLNRQQSNTISLSSSMPLGCKRQRNWGPANPSNKEDVENAKVDPFASGAKLSLTHRASPPPSHSQQTNSGRTVHLELDQALIENMVRLTGMDHNVDFDEMKGESKKLLTHYFACPIKDTCLRCKFVVLSCSFMSVLMKSPALQRVISCNSSDMPLPSNQTTSDGINLTTNRRFG